MRFGHKNQQKERTYETIDSFLARDGVIVECPSKRFQSNDFNPVYLKGRPIRLGDNSGCYRVGVPL